MTPNNQIRSNSKRTRYYVDNELLVPFGKILKPHGIAVYNALAKHANSKTQSCFPSYETIMSQAGIGKRNTVTKYLKLLEKHRLIVVERSKGKKPNIYRLLDVDEWVTGGIQKDTVEKDNYDGNGILKSTKLYPFSAENSIPNDNNRIPMDTQNHINKSDKFKSDKEIGVSHNIKTVDAHGEQKRKIEILAKMKKELIEKGVFSGKTAKKE